MLPAASSVGLASPMAPVVWKHYVSKRKTKRVLVDNTNAAVGHISSVSHQNRALAGASHRWGIYKNEEQDLYTQAWHL